MNSVDKQYFELLNHLLKNGVTKKDRTGTGTISVFDYTMRFNMSEGFPLLTSKKMFTKGVIHELIWFLRGDTNIKYLVDNDCNIWNGDAYKNYLKHNDEVSNYWIKKNPEIESRWKPYSQEEFINKIKTDDEFAKKWGELGPVYGKQWRDWTVYKSNGHQWSDRDKDTAYYINNGIKSNIDQIANLINYLKTNPDSRRLMVSAWNVGDIENMVLPPCHYGFQCYTQEMNSYERKMWWCESLGKNISYAEDLEETELDSLNVPKRRLSLKWIQRSVDSLLGLPFNIASYGLLLHLLAKEVNMVPNELIFSGGDVHLYTNHIQQAKEQLKRQTFDLPTLELTNTSLDDLKYEDVKILNYQSDKVLKAELSN
jgi:thymidylate synthase